MHRAVVSTRLTNIFNVGTRYQPFELPLFLCPRAICSTRPRRRGFNTVRSSPQAEKSTWSTQRRCLHSQKHELEAGLILPEPPRNVPVSGSTPNLPKQCRGCGALSQTSNPGQAGYYHVGRKAVKEWLGILPEPGRRRSEFAVYEDALKHLDQNQLEQHGVDFEALTQSMPPAAFRPEPRFKRDRTVPLCDRCHYLVHNSKAEPIYHPTIQDIADTLKETPWKSNHVYHVIDAADFPMSLIPRISELLEAMPLRSRNRRSRVERYYHDQKTEIHFIITRADLLAPTGEKLQRLVPYLQGVLRDALGRQGHHVRLGNLSVVSAKRGWWLQNLKETLYEERGAVWMIGKTNVGKSRLVKEIFPSKAYGARMPGKIMELGASREDSEEAGLEEQDEMESSDEFSLLPPAPKETQYPDMPVVSELPGTTASPIRLPFGNGRGEIIDMPGMDRSGLSQYVQTQHQPSLVMRDRIVPEQLTIKPGQSLLLGGFIRITPREPAILMLSYSFMRIEPHVTNTDKALRIQAQTGEHLVENIAAPEAADKTELAGSFPLKWDVTKARSGPLTAKGGIGLKVDRLPYRVLSADILIEGVGWVEIVAQVRAKDLYTVAEPQEVEPPRLESLTPLERLNALAGERSKDPVRIREQPERESDANQGEPNWPIVDVYSPEGKFVSVRPPMNGWVINKPLQTAASRKSRPRKSMKGMKKLEKRRQRETE